VISGRPIDWDLIAQRYDQLVKYATALKLGTAEADATVRALCLANVPFRNLDIAAASLEDTFLALVHEEATP